MDWRTDTPPKVYYKSNSRSPKRDRDESTEAEQQLQHKRPNGFALSGSAPAGYARVSSKLPAIGNGFTGEDYRHFGQHELTMDNNYRQLNNRNILANAPAANTPHDVLSIRHYRMDESALGRPLQPQPNVQQQAQGQSSQWWQCCTSVLNAVTVLVTYVSVNVVKPLGDRTFRAGRFVYQNRHHATETVTDTVTTFTEGATAAKRRILQFVRRQPHPVRRRSPPRRVVRPHPHMTSTRAQLENEERARREALEAAAMDTTEFGVGHFEPVMSGATQSPEYFQPTMSAAIQKNPESQPPFPSVHQSAADFHLSMPGAIPEDIIPTTGSGPNVPTGTDFTQQTTAGQVILPYTYSPGPNICDSTASTRAMEAVKEYLCESTLDIPYNSDSDMDEILSDDAGYMSPITDDMDLELEPLVHSAQWPAITELQWAHAEDDEAEMDFTLEIDELSEIDSSQTPQPAISGLSNITPSPPNQVSSMTPQEPQSSPLSDVPSDFDMTLAVMTPLRPSLKKSVGFYESPKTGRPVDRVKKYYIGESMAHPVSSSPPERSEGSSISSTIDSDVSIYDDPIMEAAAAAHMRSIAQEKQTSSIAMDQPSLACAVNGGILNGNPDPAGNVHPRSLVPVTIGHTEIEIVGSAGYMPADASLNPDRRTNIDRIDSEIVGAVGSAPAAASLAFHGPILAPIQNNQYVGRQTRRRSGATSFMVTAEGSPIKKRPRSPAVLARSLSRLSVESMLMQENATSPAKLVSAPTMIPAEFASLTSEGERVSPAEISAESDKRGFSAEQEGDTQKQDTAAEGIATPGPRGSTSNQSTPQQDLTTQLGSLRVSDRRLSVRRRRKELEEQKLREEEEQRVADEKARREREEAEAAAEKARLEKEKAEEEARAVKEAEEERKRTSVREIPAESVIQPLTADWEAKVDAAMAKQRNHVLANTSTGTSLTRKDFGTLFPQQGKDPASGWLNDEIIMAYLQAVIDHGREISGYKDGDIPKYHAFNTFFFKNIRDKGVQSVKRWATRAKIGGKSLESVERVFIPVHSGAHWTLLIVSPITRTIEYFDSMDGATEPYTKAARDWLKQEMGKGYKEEEWTIVLPKGGGPQQSNGSDCGVFTVTTAKMVLLGIDPTAYSSLDIPLQRKRMVAELMNGGFTADFAPNFTFKTG